MTHAEIIFRALDRHLGAPTSLIIFGRAALVLGFNPAPDNAALSLDVDAILPATQSTALNSDAAFWVALEAANRDLEPSGLYLTHLFEEFQVILRPDWHENIVPITHPELSRLTVSLRRRVQPPQGAYRASIIWTAPAMERVLRASPCPARLPIPSTTSTSKTTRPSRSATGSTRGRRRHISATSSSARSTGR